MEYVALFRGFDNTYMYVIRGNNAVVLILPFTRAKVSIIGFKVHQKGEDTGIFDARQMHVLNTRREHESVINPGLSQ